MPPIPPRNPMAHTPMTRVQDMEARRAQQGGPKTAADVIRERIAAREAGLPEPALVENRMDDGRVRGGELDVARELDAALAAEAAAKAGKGRGR